MEQYLCANVYVPLRMGPSHKAEMGSQILFGEQYKILDKIANWILIELLFDGYQGWIDSDHHLFFNISAKQEESYVLGQTTEFITESGPLTLEAGSDLYKLTEKRFTIGGISFKSESAIVTGDDGKSITDLALGYLNSPYMWGGRIGSGMDCSGLTQLVYKIKGHGLPRDSWKQAEAGETIPFISESKPGDLLFFDNESGKINHVGIMYDNRHIIHCSGKVRIDKVDHQGIYREDEKRYTHKLRTIKRIINNKTQ